MNSFEDTEIQRLRAIIRRIAAYWVQRWAWHQDQRALIDDCEGAGWIVALRYGGEHPRLSWEVQNAVQDEIARWLYGVTRGQRARTVGVAVAPSMVERIPDSSADALTRLIQREAIDQGIESARRVRAPRPIGRLARETGVDWCWWRRPRPRSHRIGRPRTGGACGYCERRDQTHRPKCPITIREGLSAVDRRPEANRRRQKVVA